MDGNELARLKLRDGSNFQTLVNDLEAGLNDFNSSINSGYLGRLVSVTTERPLNIAPAAGMDLNRKPRTPSPIRNLAILADTCSRSKN